jgi:nitronate monooxygenase
MTARVSGTPAAVIRTPYMDSLGVDPPLLLRLAKGRPRLREQILKLMHVPRMRGMEHAEIRPTWKTVWSADQSVGLVHQVKSCSEIVNEIVAECLDVMAEMRNMVSHADDGSRVG